MWLTRVVSAHVVGLASCACVHVCVYGPEARGREAGTEGRMRVAGEGPEKSKG